MDNMYKVSSNIFDLNTPQTIVPSPTPSDYELGFIMRYFVRRANDLNGFIYEIDEHTFESYKDKPFWLIAELKWRIAGPLDVVYKSNGDIDDRGVVNSNKTSIMYTSKVLPNISLYLPNILQFYK
jgi:hypothetical protein